MKDDVLIRLLQDANHALEGVGFPVETPNLVPIYNALLGALKANHQGQSYVQALLPVESAGPDELRVLFGQLRILLESLIETPPSAGGMTRRLDG